jgi:hypothetical protein
LSARLCASLKIDGDPTSFLLETRLGHLKGRNRAFFELNGRALPF